MIIIAQAFGFRRGNKGPQPLAAVSSISVGIRLDVLSDAKCIIVICLSLRCVSCTMENNPGRHNLLSFSANTAHNTNILYLKLTDFDGPQVDCSLPFVEAACASDGTSRRMPTLMLLTAASGCGAFIATLKAKGLGKFALKETCFTLLATVSKTQKANAQSQKCSLERQHGSHARVRFGASDWPEDRQADT